MRKHHASNQKFDQRGEALYREYVDYTALPDQRSSTLYIGAIKAADMGGQADDANALRSALRSQGSILVIPARINRRRKIAYDTRRYRDRHLIENAFCRLKDVRRMATRYDRLTCNFLSGVALATLIAFRV